MMTHIIIYTKRMHEMVAFYTQNFGFEDVTRADDRIIELCHPEGGTRILLHAAAKNQKEGQVLAKLVIDAADVAQMRERLLAQGIDVGPVHDGGGYQFANLKDPSKNPVCISSRCLRSSA